MTKPEAREPAAKKRHGGKYIYDVLRQEILTLKLHPSTQLDELSLAERFALSRSPVRDALARLVAEGLAVTLPNRTTIVSPLNIEDFSQYIAAFDLLQRATTRLAAMNRTQEHLDNFQRLNHEYADALHRHDYQAMFELNKQFHIEVARAGQNRYLAEYYEKLLEEGQRLQYMQFDYIVNQQLAMEADHDELMDSIVAQDLDAAEHAAHRHTVLFQERFLDYMRRNNTETIAIGL